MTVFDTSTHWFYNPPGLGNHSNITQVEWEELYPNFSIKEIASGPDQRRLVVYRPAMNALQALRTSLGLPLKINSAYRTRAHNTAVGGSPNSQHLLGRAFDISIRRYGRHEQSFGDDIEDLAVGLGFKGFGRYPTFIHIDMRLAPGVTYWDKR